MKVYKTEEGYYGIKFSKVDNFINDLKELSKQHQKNKIPLLTLYLSDYTISGEENIKSFELELAQEKGLYDGANSLNKYCLEVMAGVAARNNDQEIIEDLVGFEKVGILQMIGEEAIFRIFSGTDFLLPIEEIKEVAKYYSLNDSKDQK